MALVCLHRAPPWYSPSPGWDGGGGAGSQDLGWIVGGGELVRDLTLNGVTSGTWTLTPRTIPQGGIGPWDTVLILGVSETSPMGHGTH